MQIRYRTELPDLMRRLGLPMTAVEVGVAEGLHSYELLKNGIEKLYMVDLWKSVNQKGDASQPQEWHDNNFINVITNIEIEGYGEKAIPLKGFSADMAKFVPDDSLGLVYVDGDHSYNGVMTDLKVWFPKLVKGGIMAGHDFLAPEYGVKQAVEEWVNTMGDKVSKIYLLLENKREDAGFYLFKL